MFCTKNYPIISTNIKYFNSFHSDKRFRASLVCGLQSNVKFQPFMSTEMFIAIQKDIHILVRAYTVGRKTCFDTNRWQQRNVK